MRHAARSILLLFLLALGGCNRDSHSLESECVPAVSCATAQAECGFVDNGCGYFVDCGDCELPQICGGDVGAASGKCGCRPLDCEQMGANCGQMDDGCGGEVSCGECDRDPGLTCGGGGVPHVCGFPVCQDSFCYQSQHPMLDTQLGIFTDFLDRTWAVGVQGSVYLRVNRNWSSVMAYTRVLSDLHDVWVFSDKDGWAVGQNGAILRFDGDRFHCQYLDENQDTEYWSPVKYDLHGIWARGRDDVWVVGTDGILKFDGAQWKVVARPAGSLRAIHGLADGSMIAGGSRGDPGRQELLVLTHEGESWIKSQGIKFNIRGEIRDITEASSGRVFAVGITYDAAGDSQGGFLIARDNDARENGEWSLIADNISEPVYTAEVDASGVLWFAGKNGLLGSLQDGEISIAPAILGQQDIYSLSRKDELMEMVGAQGIVGTYDGLWNLSRLKIPSSKGDRIVWSRTTNDVWAGGDRFVMHWNGSTWEIASVEAEILGFYGTAHDNVFAAGNDARGNGIVYRFDGDALNEMTRHEVKVRGITGSSSADIRVTLENDTILHYDGSTWEERKTGDFAGEPSGDLIAPAWILDADGFSREGEEPYHTEIWPFDGLQRPPRATWGLAEDDIYVGGGDGIIHYDGATWSKLLAGVSIDSIAGRESKGVWFVGSKGDAAFMLHRRQGESATVDVSELGEGRLTDISIDESGAIYVSGDNLYRYDSEKWEQILEGEGDVFTSVTAFSRENIWAAAGMGIYNFDGASWNRFDTPDLMTLIPINGNTNVYVDQIFALQQDFILFRGGTDDGEVAVLLVYDNGEWSNRTLENLGGGEASFTALWGSGPENVYVTMGQLGYLYRYKHQARIFTEVWAPIAESLTAIWGTPENELWVFGPHGAILSNIGNI